MNKVNAYSRNYLYFKLEDKGFDNGREPLGFISFDVRDGKGRLTAFVENLSESDKYEYKLYLISSTESRIIPVLVAKIKLVNNKAQINWSFDASNIGGSRLSLEDFNIAAVIVDYKDRNSGVLSPLAAYRGEKAEWRSKLKDVLYRKNSEVLSKYESSVSQSDYNENFEQKNKVNQAERTYTTQSDVIPNHAQVSGQIDQINQKYQINQNEQTAQEDQIVQEDQADQAEQTTYMTAVPSDLSRKDEQAANTEQTDESEASSMARGNIIYSNPNNHQNSYIYNNIDNNPNNNIGYNLNNNIGNNPNNNIDNNQNNNAASQEGTIPCNNCNVGDCNKVNRKTRKNNDKFTYTFDRYLERFDPFNSGRKDYVWWKANSAYYLNTVLYWINVRTPIMLSPSVFNAVSKYGHLIVGIYTDMSTNEKHLVFGIPGKYGTEVKPFGELARWAQADLRKPEYDAFGYWLIYMDPYTARVIE